MLNETPLECVPSLYTHTDPEDLKVEESSLCQGLDPAR